MRQQNKIKITYHTEEETQKKVDIGGIDLTKLMQPIQKKEGDTLADQAGKKHGIPKHWILVLKTGVAGLQFY